jgi:malonate decarboxylase epsilon subunit
MKKVLSLAVRQGAHKAELLDVAVPSHCPLMEPVARSLKAQLATIRISDPTTIYIANMNARAMRSAEEIRTDLAESVAHGVRWNEATNVAKELGCALFFRPLGDILWWILFAKT